MVSMGQQGRGSGSAVDVGAPDEVRAASSFDVLGVLAGRSVVVRYRDGHLSGDERAVAAVRAFLAHCQPVRLSAPQPGEPTTMRNPVAMAAAIHLALDSVSDIDLDPRDVPAR